jgi:hypothetical protein
MVNSILANISPFQKWINGTKTISTNITPLSIKSVICRSIRLMAKSTNTGKIFIGSDNLTTDNYSIFLNANESIDIEIDNLAKVYLIAEVDSEGVNYTYVI